MSEPTAAPRDPTAPPGSAQEEQCPVTDQLPVGNRDPLSEGAEKGRFETRWGG